MRYRSITAALLLLLASNQIANASVWDDAGERVEKARIHSLNHPAKAHVEKKNPNQVLFTDLQSRIITARKSMRFACIPLWNIPPNMTLNSTSAQAAFVGIKAGAGQQMSSAMNQYLMDENLMPEYLVKAQLLASAEAERKTAVQAMNQQAASEVMTKAGGIFGATGSNANPDRETGSREAINALAADGGRIWIADKFMAHNQRLASVMPGSQIDCYTGQGRVVGGPNTFEFSPGFVVRQVHSEQDGFKSIVTIPQPSRQAPEQLVVNLSLQSSAMSPMSATLTLDAAGNAKLVSLALDVDISANSSRPTIDARAHRTKSDKTELMKTVQGVYEAEFSSQVSLVEFIRTLFLDPDARTALVTK